MERRRRKGERRRRKEEERGGEEGRGWQERRGFGEGRGCEEGRGWQEGSLEEGEEEGMQGEQGEDSCWSSWRNITPSPGRQCTEWLVISRVALFRQNVEILLALCLKVIIWTVGTFHMFMVSHKISLTAIYPLLY